KPSAMTAMAHVMPNVIARNSATSVFHGSRTAPSRATAPLIGLCQRLEYRHREPAAADIAGGALAHLVHHIRKANACVGVNDHQRAAPAAPEGRVWIRSERERF